MSKRTQGSSLRRYAFTLVEVLIVVVILAILAGTVIPQFTSSSDDAKDSAALYNLHTLRAQIELYKVQHNGVAPPLADATLAKMLTSTNAAGAEGTGSDYPFGPYLSGSIPPNPITGDSTVVATATYPPASATSGGGGWLYHEATGQIFIDHEDYLTY